MSVVNGMLETHLKSDNVTSGSSAKARDGSMNDLKFKAEGRSHLKRNVYISRERILVNKYWITDIGRRILGDGIGHWILDNGY